MEGHYRYGLIRRLGRGSFGCVFLAQCMNRVEDDPHSPPERVALKVLQAPKGLENVHFFRRELSSLLALRCDRIPRVYDWNITGDMAFIVMDYYAAGSLYDQMPFVCQMPETTAWRLLVDLLTALDAAHQQSILHLDVKPSNVLLDNEGGFVLGDFGISQGCLVTPSVVHPGIGSPGFRSPEQENGDYESFDVRTDLWGVGTTAWSLLTGIHLGSRPELLTEERAGRVYGLPALRMYRPECSPFLEEIVMGLLVRDQNKRPGCAAEVLARIHKVGPETEFDTETYAQSRSAPKTHEEIREMVEGLPDPLWRMICRRPGFYRHIIRFADKDILCAEGEASYKTFVLLRGEVAVERDRALLGREHRCGTFLGEVSTLTGKVRTATLRAEGEVWACVFNASELEQFVALNPAIGIRLIKALAQRLYKESQHIAALEAPPSGSKADPAKKNE